jgi:hypothetical protein
VTYWSWRGIFLVNVPLGLVLIGLSAVFSRLPRAHRGRRLDLPGVALLSAAPCWPPCSAWRAWAAASRRRPPSCSPGPRRHPADPVRPAQRPRKSPVHPGEVPGRPRLRRDEPDQLPRLRGLGFGALVPLYAENRFGIPTLGAGTLLTARARSAWSR